MPPFPDLHGDSPHRSVFTKFSRWTRWNPKARESIPTSWTDYPLHKFGGVYLLAHLPGGALDAPADFLDDRIVYVGESQRLGTRWEEFDRSAGHTKSGHAGGHSYRAVFGAPREDLHVAALGVWVPVPVAPLRQLNPWTAFYRNLIERHILWSLLVERARTDVPEETAKLWDLRDSARNVVGRRRGLLNKR
jgi:hypothetical protein